MAKEARVVHKKETHEHDNAESEVGRTTTEAPATAGEYSPRDGDEANKGKIDNKPIEKLAYNMSTTRGRNATDSAGRLTHNPDVERMLGAPEVRADAARLAKNPNILLADMSPVTVALIGSLIVDKDSLDALANSAEYATLARKAKQYAGIE